MSIDTLLASASLPELFAAVEIDGEHYWDGGYGGNPTLWPMIHSSLGDDIGVRETLNVGGVYVDSRKPKLRMPASHPRLNLNITALSHAA